MASAEWPGWASIWDTFVKYDCLLAPTFIPRVPSDRHIFAKRARLVNADGFITPLDLDNLIDFAEGPPAHWRFVANAGDGGPWKFI